MKTIGVLNQKGGVGKTTITTCLAVAFEQEGKKTAIFDLDPQATSCFWSDTRKSKSLAVISIQPIRLKSMLDGAKDAGTEIVIVDGAAIQREIAYDVASVADFVLIPTKPAVFDITSMQETIKALKQHSTPFAIVLNMVSPHNKEEHDIKEITDALEARLSNVTIGNRKDFFRAQSLGLAVQEYNAESKAAHEIIALYNYIKLYI